MTEDLVTVGESETLARAGGLMSDAGVRSIVVTDPTSQPVGILTSSDFVQLAADEQPPTDADVAEYVTKYIVTTAPGTVVYEAANLMLEHDISHLPVVDDDESLL